MLCLSLQEADRLHRHTKGTARAKGDAFTTRRLSRADVLAPNGMRFSDYVHAGVGVTRFLQSGFTLPELLSIGLSGASVRKITGTALSDKRNGCFALKDHWDELTTWTMVDLAMAGSDQADMAFLGVTLPKLRARGLLGAAFVAMTAMTMQAWHAFGIDKADLQLLGLTGASYRAMGWGYASMQMLWGFSVDDMSHVGFTLKM
jgi:hypothetical protein